MKVIDRRSSVILPLLACPCLLFYSLLSEAIRQTRCNQALIEAVKHEDRQAVVLALEMGADPNSRDQGSNPVTQVARLKKLWNTYASKHTASPTALMIAIEDPDAVAISELLIYKGADVNAKNAKGDTAFALLLKAWNGHTPDEPKLLKLLVKRGSDINAIFSDGSTALQRTAAVNDAEDVAFLLKRGANVNFQDPEGLSALMLAAMHGCDESIRLLLMYGARTDLKDKKGRTALDIARLYGFEGAIRKLSTQRVSTKNNIHEY